MLTELQCHAAKPAEKRYKLTDGRGLFLFVTNKSYRSWRWKYRIAGKEKLLVFGSYPEVSLKTAREMRDQAAIVLRTGADPSIVKRPASVPKERTLENVARRWHSNQKSLWSAVHSSDIIRSLKREVFLVIGQVEIAHISLTAVRDILKNIQDNGAVGTAHRIRGRLSAIFEFAIADGLTDTNPSSSIVKALKPIKKGHRPALIKLDEARAFLAAVEAQPAPPVIKLASRLLAITAVRPGVIRFAAPAEFEGLDTAEPIWRISANCMKLVQEKKHHAAYDFIVSLPPQAVDVVKMAMELSSGEWLFPMTRSFRKQISENAIGYMYNRVPGYGVRHVPHEWPASFSTIMNERAATLDRPEDRQIIDMMLAHIQSGVEPIYNRAAYMPRRRQLARDWVDLLLEGFPAASDLLDGPRR